MAKSRLIRHFTTVTSLRAYLRLEDAWTDGVAEWCRAATPFVLSGGRAWFVTVSDGQANWIKQRLLAEGVSLFGVQFLDARALRRELCGRAGLPAPALGQETLQFLLRLHAIHASTPGSEWSAVARHPEACLSALDDFAAAGWLDELGLVDDVLPSTIDEWLPQLRATDSWTPDIDRRLVSHFAADPAGREHLSVCVFGWDANHWGRFDLLTAAVRAAGSAYLYTPLPRGTSETVQQAWLEACETTFGVERTDCDDSLFVSAQAALADRLEGADLDDASAPPPEPELLTGVDADDAVALVRDYVARWLASPPTDDDPETDHAVDRLAILCPGRTPSAVALVRALTDAKIAVEDELGELPQPSLAVQIQRAMLDYHLERGGLEPLLAIVELLNEHAAIWQGRSAQVLREVFPLDAVEVRRALHGAFAEVQHHSARLLSSAASVARTPVAQPLRRLIEHLGEWPDAIPWQEALDRWRETLAGFGLSTEVLEPLWSRLASLPVPELVPSSAFFHYLGSILGAVPARRDPDASHRFARIVITTLEGAAGQTWGAVVLLDSNEGAWPLYPPENPFLSDATRTFLNARRAGADATAPGTFRGHLLTASDRAQLEQFHFLEVLQNCRGPLAFAAASSDPADPNKEFYPNEWVLRCLVEARRAAGHEGRLLDRWRRSIRRTRRTHPRLGKSEAAHLHDVWAGRRDPATPFDEYFFNFIALTGPDELPWADAWSAGELEAASNRPATFALGQIFGTQAWHDHTRSLTRGEGWTVGRLVHRWLHTALDATREPRRLTAEDWTRALTRGLPRARAESEAALRTRLTPAHAVPRDSAPPAPLPLWWQGVLRKAVWATRRCLETLAETAARQPDTPLWLAMNQHFQSELTTAAGPLRLRTQSDVVFLDRPEIDGAVCQIIDIRTGAAPATTAPTASQFEQGKGLHTATTLLLALAAGAEADGSRAGVVHPDASQLTLSVENVRTLVQPTLERLARQQRTLIFGQKGTLVNAHDPGQTEELPLATTPVEPIILAAKSQITAL